MKELKKEGDILNRKREKGLIPVEQDPAIIKDFNKRQWDAFVESERDRKQFEKENFDSRITDVATDVINSTFNHPTSFVISMSEERHKEIFGK